MGALAASAGVEAEADPVTATVAADPARHDERHDERDPGPGSGPGPGAAGGTGHRRGLTLADGTGWLLAFVGFVIGARTLADNSFLTHLATGRLILAQRAVPTVDPYTYLARGQTWTIQSWLVSLLYGGLDATLGPWAIRLAHGLAGALITQGLWRLVAPARQLVVRVGLVGLVLLTGSYLWSPRPLLFGLLALVVTLQVVQGQRRPGWLVAVFWLWVNSHGSFVMGLGLLGAVAVGAAIDRRRWPGPELVRCGLAVAGCLAAVVNPVGWRLLWFPIELMGRSSALTGVAEWSPPTFDSVPEKLFLVLGALIVVAARRRCPWRQLLPAGVFFVAGLLAVRNLGLASLVIVALLAPSLAGLASGLRIEGEQGGRPARLTAFSALAGFLVAALAVMTAPAIDLSDYPVAQVDWLEARSLVASDGVVLGERDIVGNYLVLRYGPQARVFMDDRFDFHPLDVVADHRALLMGGDMAPILARRGFDVILWATKSPLYRWLQTDPHWHLMLVDDSWFVACRDTSPVYTRCLQP